MSNVSPLALLDPVLVDPLLTDPALDGLAAEPAAGPAAPRLWAVPSPIHPASPAAPTAAGVYRLPDATVDAAMVGYLVLVPVGTELDVTAVPARQPEPRPVAAGPVPAPVAAEAPPAAAHGIALDLERRTARVDGEVLELTYLEFELLAHLTAHPHRVHTRDHLVSAVWGYGHVGDGRTVDVHVARLRRKLGRYRDGIVTVRRVGYKYVPAGAR